MKGIAMKTASVVAFAVFCSIIGAAAVYGEEVVTEPIRTFGGHTGYVWSVAFSPDGTKVLTGSDDKTARLWDAATGVHIRTFGHTGAVYSVAYSPDGTEVLTGSFDSKARLWNAATGAHIGTFSGHASQVRSVAFSPDGTKVLTGSRDKMAYELRLLRRLLAGRREGAHGKRRQHGPAVGCGHGRGHPHVQRAHVLSITEHRVSKQVL